MKVEFLRPQSISGLRMYGPSSKELYFSGSRHFVAYNIAEAILTLTKTYDLKEYILLEMNPISNKSDTIHHIFKPNGTHMMALPNKTREQAIKRYSFMHRKVETGHSPHQQIFDAMEQEQARIKAEKERQAAIKEQREARKAEVQRIAKEVEEEMQQDFGSWG